jgi:hypothetical protein
MMIEERKIKEKKMILLFFCGVGIREKHVPDFCGKLYIP